MKARQLNALIAEGRERAAALEPKLALAYQVALGRAGERAAQAFAARVVDPDAVVATAKWTPPQLEDVLDAETLAESARQKTKATQRAMLKEQIGESLAEAGVSWTVRHPLSQDLLNGLAARAADIADGLRAPIAQAIAEGFTSGKSVPDTARAIREAVSGVKGWQATMLARNDLIGVSNGGGLMQARMLKAVDPTSAGLKTWLSAGDALVRPSHAAASGQTVKLDQPFNVGSSLMQYPGDPGGAHADVVNCRCVQLFVDEPPSGKTSSVRDGSEKGEAAQLVLGDAPDTASIYAEGGVYGEARRDGGREVGSVAAHSTEAAPLGCATAAAGGSLSRVKEFNGTEWVVRSTRRPISDVAQLALDGKLPDCSALVAAADDEGEQIRWHSPDGIAFENFGTDDGRWFEAGCWEWREPPLTLMAMVETTEGGHLGAQVAGRIDELSKGPKGEEGRIPILSAGIFDSGEYGANIARLVGDRTLTGISVDYAVEEWAFRDPETGEIIAEEDMTEDDWERAFFGDLDFATIKATIMAATVCPTPAFGDAKVAIAASGQKIGTLFVPIEIWTEHSGLTAAAAGLVPERPPAEWFEDPKLSGPTGLTITDEGRVFGHLALWDSCHIGEPQGAGVCTSPPNSATGYSYFHLGEVQTEDGSMVSTGKITFDTGHASLRASRAAATKHYDDTGAVAADVRAGEDEHGIWLAGALRPEFAATDVRLLRAAQISGDWRRVNGNLEMVAALAVNVPGFPVPRVAALVEPATDAQANGGLAAFTLVAAGIVGNVTGYDGDTEAQLDALGVLAGVTDL